MNLWCFWFEMRLNQRRSGCFKKKTLVSHLCRTILRLESTETEHLPAVALRALISASTERGAKRGSGRGSAVGRISFCVAPSEGVWCNFEIPNKKQQTTPFLPIFPAAPTQNLTPHSVFPPLSQKTTTKSNVTL